MYLLNITLWLAGLYLAYTINTVRDKTLGDKAQFIISNGSDSGLLADSG
jgi:hypothetical protein